MLPQLDVSTYVSQIIWLVFSFTGLFLSVRYWIVPYFEKTLHQRAHERQALQSTCARMQRQIHEVQEAQKTWFLQAESDLETFCSQEMMAEERAHHLRKQEIQAHFEDQLREAIQTLQKEACDHEKDLERHSQTMARILSDHFQLKGLKSNEMRGES